AEAVEELKRLELGEARERRGGGVELVERLGAREQFVAAQSRLEIPQAIDAPEPVAVELPDAREVVPELVPAPRVAGEQLVKRTVRRTGEPTVAPAAGSRLLRPVAGEQRRRELTLAPRELARITRQRRQ